MKRIFKIYSSGMCSQFLSIVERRLVCKWQMVLSSKKQGALGTTKYLVWGKNCFKPFKLKSPKTFNTDICITCWMKSRMFNKNKFKNRTKSYVWFYTLAGFQEMYILYHVETNFSEKENIYYIGKARTLNIVCFRYTILMWSINFHYWKQNERKRFFGCLPLNFERWIWSILIGFIRVPKELSIYFENRKIF